jgi:type I restriction enzyme, R subunit
VIEAKSNEYGVGEGVGRQRTTPKNSAQFHLRRQRQRDLSDRNATGGEGTVQKFPTPDELWQKAFTKPTEWEDRFNPVPFEDISGTKPPAITFRRSPSTTPWKPSPKTRTASF